MTDSRPDDPFPFDLYSQSFSVPFDFPVYYTHNDFDPENPHLSSVIDRLLARAHRHLLMPRPGSPARRPLIFNPEVKFGSPAARTDGPMWL
jgi:hypothetical protein